LDPVKRSISNLVRKLTVVSTSVGMIDYPQNGVRNLEDHFSYFKSF